jgi:hypothetical protein
MAYPLERRLDRYLAVRQRSGHLASHGERHGYEDGVAGPCTTGS